MRKKLLTMFCAVMLLLAFSATGALAGDLKPVNDLKTDYNNAIENSFTWSKQGNSQIFNAKYLAEGLVGTTNGDWTAIAAGRYGYGDNNLAYLKELENYVTKTYAEKNGKLDNSKATEWQRIAIGVVALGGDPTNFGSYQGKPINLIADGVYNCKIGDIMKQGINGAVFGLLALDSKGFKVPSNGDYDREILIEKILKREIKGGGFATAASAASPDPDMTGMVLQSLAPYYGQPEVKAAIDRSLVWLSSVQTNNGGFVPSGSSVTSSESSVQVLTALCALKINPISDSRFVKNGKTVLDDLQRYYVHSDGGFSHSLSADANSPNADAGKSNPMATDQVRYGLIAYNCFVNEEKTFYDFSQIKTLNIKVNFADVKTSDWFYDSVYRLASQEIINGITTTAFEPQGQITRAQFGKILAMSYTKDLAAYDVAGNFADVNNHWAKKYINWANAQGVVNGVEADKFCPDAPISRQDMAVMIARYAKNVVHKTLPQKNAPLSFNDGGSIAEYAVAAVSDMQKAGIINGKGNNIFDPTGNATRGEAGKMIAYFLRLI
ncbi:MAG: S-layer homology domain-containing protein [Clostridiales bacterium]